MILLQAAQTVSDAPQGGISWGWAWGIAAGIIVLLTTVMIKLGKIVWDQYKTLNENRMEAQKQNHDRLVLKFDEMKNEYRSDKQTTNLLIEKFDRRLEAVETKMDQENSKIRK